MKNHNTYFDDIAITASQSTFKPSSGKGVVEHMLILKPQQPLHRFEMQLAHLLEALHRMLSCHNDCSLVMLRVFLSDAANQMPLLSDLSNRYPQCAMSVIEQAPLDGTKIAFWAWLQSDVQCNRLNPHFTEVKHGAYTQLWSATMQAQAPDSRAQMRSIFDAYVGDLEAQSCQLAHHCIRTWIFVQNVDVNYAGVVTGRNELFDEHDLVPGNHFISSTGIQGRTAEPSCVVQMEAVALKGVEPAQIQFLYAPAHLNPTHEYGVRFERGTCVHFGDRSHCYISGTASIDNKGDVVHVGDIEKQCLRMWENVQALLAEGQFSMQDIAQMLVYLRDPSDYLLVSQLFEKHFPYVPTVILLAPVCRPTWLIEMECVAIRDNAHSSFAPF